MDEFEKQIAGFRIRKSNDLDNRNELLKNIKNCIHKINTELEFFACEFTYIFGVCFEPKNGKKYEYIFCIEDDRFVEYRTVTEKDGTSDLKLNYWGTDLRLVSDNGLKETLENLENFIDGFEKGTLEQNYELV